jgi:hypothetical protein
LTPTALVRSDRDAPSYPFRQNTISARSNARLISKERGRPIRFEDLFRSIPIYDASSIPIGTNIVSIQPPVTSVLAGTEIGHEKWEIKQEKAHE